MFHKFIDAVKLTIKMADGEKARGGERAMHACKEALRTNYTYYISLNKLLVSLPFKIFQIYYEILTNFICIDNYLGVIFL